MIPAASPVIQVVISSYCIGSDGPVRTVSILRTRKFINSSVYLDFHSRTSVQLAKILNNIEGDVELIPAEKGFIDKIGGDTGALVIGDRTIELQKHSHIYDLSAAWKDWTGKLCFCSLGKQSGFT